jgi:hypothetical protein
MMRVWSMIGAFICAIASGSNLAEKAYGAAAFFLVGAIISGLVAIQGCRPPSGR